MLGTLRGCSMRCACVFGRRRGCPRLAAGVLWSCDRLRGCSGRLACVFGRQNGCPGLPACVLWSCERLRGCSGRCACVCGRQSGCPGLPACVYGYERWFGCSGSVSAAFALSFVAAFALLLSSWLCSHRGAFWTPCSVHLPCLLGPFSPSSASLLVHWPIHIFSLCFSWGSCPVMAFRFLAG